MIRVGVRITIRDGVRVSATVMARVTATVTFTVIRDRFRIVFEGHVACVGAIEAMHGGPCCSMPMYAAFGNPHTPS